MKLTKIILLCVLACITLTNCALNSNNKTTPLSLSAPKSVESGKLVPIAVQIPSKMTADNTLSIEVDGETAATYSLTKAFIINRIGINVRMAKSAEISVVLKHKGDTVDEISQYIKVEQGQSIPTSGEPGLGRKTRIGKSIIQVVFDNAMTKKNYINKIVIATNSGNIQIDTTPLISASPYFSIQTISNIAKVHIKAETNNKESWAMLSSAVY